MAHRVLKGRELWFEEGGSEGPILVLLHGLGATGEVWRGLIAVLRREWAGPWMVLDLAGHGRSAWCAPYSFGQHAADVAVLAGGAGPLVALGHSMGGVVALALAGGLFGVDVIAAIGIGIKVVWTPEELAWASALATRPIKWFEDGAEAEAFFLRVSGLEGLATPGGELAASGVVAEGGRYRLAADPAGALVGAPPMASLMAAASAPVHLACGTRDHLTSVEQLRRFDPGATELPGLGHNAHVEDPERTWGFVAQTLG